MEKKKQNNQFSKDVKGYSYNKRRGTFQAEIQIKKRKIYLGVYDTAEEARNAYLEARERYSYYLESPRAFVSISQTLNADCDTSVSIACDITTN